MKNQMTICIVAPYSPVGTDSPNLGASRKLETYISILSKIASRIVLVNSAHNSTGFARTKVAERQIAGAAVTEICPPQLPNRQLGKLAQLFIARRLAKAVQKKYSPELTWLYNGYSFECIFGSQIGTYSVSALILEFEDWHFARKRHFSLKPVIDHYFWKRLAPSIKHAFCVNDYLANKLRPFGTSTTVIPGLIPEEIAKLSEIATPFKDSGTSELKEKYTVGYFGGLSTEKGASLILDLIKSSDLNCRYIVCGTGELLKEFKNLAGTLPNILSVSSQLPFEEMVTLMSQCDVLLNPHKVTKNFLEGVFPSKVLEAIGSGRMVISTALPELSASQVLDGVFFCDETALAFSECIRKAPALYQAKRDMVQRASNLATREFGVAAVRDRIRSQLGDNRRPVE
ncbi:MAG: hypothetical protein RJA98_597 [Pseudomonadota bacterium]